MQHRGTVSRRPRRWPKGTWMKLKSPELLRAFMADKGISGYRLARYVGCHPSFIDHLLAGRRRSCLPKTAERIAEEVGAPLEVLFVVSSSSATRGSVKAGAA